MLAARIYGLLWLVIMAAALSVHLTDSFNYATTMILGLSASVLAGAGLLTVYPLLMTERVHSGRNAQNETKKKDRRMTYAEEKRQVAN